jgi:hypothetical protein
VPESVPDWVTPVLGPGGPCLICGVPGADQRHRVLDAIVDMVQAGEDPESVADDYGVPVEFVDRVVREWQLNEG